MRTINANQTRLWRDHRKRLEAIQIPLIATPLDGTTSGFALHYKLQRPVLSWDYPPPEWKALIEFHRNTMELFEHTLLC
jgi:hypothetical protein